MKITIVGTGYVGLVAGACFADTGNTVICVDKNQKKVEDLKRGILPIYEPGLEDIVKRSVKESRLFFTTETHEAVQNSDIIFLAVNTPSAPDGEPDLSFLKSALTDVAKAMNGYKVIVNKSTVPVGTQAWTKNFLKENTNQPFDVVSNPEFLKEGVAIDDFLKPDRVVIGADSQKALDLMTKLYEPFVRQGNPVISMDPVSAETTKYACNAFLAARISFMNELSVLSEKLGADIESIRKGMATDVRIGKHFLYAGAGYGGSCFPKDIKALLDTAKKQDTKLRIVKAAEEANEFQKYFIFSKVKNYFESKGGLKGKKIALWGLAFKPNTDDIREAPALIMIESLLREGATVSAFDPVASENVKKIFDQGVGYTSSAMEAIEGADAWVLLTEWNEFKNPDFSKIKKCLKNAVLFDGRNIYSPKEVRDHGFEYFGVGRA